MSDRKPDVRKPSLRTLSFVLRNRQLWPVGFKWDFSDCDHCAMGIAHRLWKERVPMASLDGMTDAFGISRDDAVEMFAYVRPRADCSAWMVADRIDAYLARAEA